ncbi:MAG: DUF1599 domain-containing protein [Spirosomaceae bacterium]|nr:DUF1599 domain-containing protein [Spirosomataceae bacterium]
MQQTEREYRSVIARCQDIFTKKNQDYGPSWRILQRIRTIQEKGFSKVQEGEVPEFIGIINYCVMALIQSELGDDRRTDFTADQLTDMYNAQMQEVIELLFNKNHDYGEAWRDMRVSSMTDIILMKLFRIKQIEDNEGKTVISEGVKAGYQDIINYSVFCLIKLGIAE